VFYSFTLNDFVLLISCQCIYYSCFTCFRHDSHTSGSNTEAGQTRTCILLQTSASPVYLLIINLS